MVGELTPQNIVEAVHGGKNSGESFLKKHTKVIVATTSGPLITAIRAVSTTIEEKIARGRWKNEEKTLAARNFFEYLSKRYNLPIANIVKQDLNGYGTCFSNWKFQDLENQNWLMKLGRKRNVNFGEYNPSDQRFALFYAGCVELVTQELGQEFIPEETKILYIGTPDNNWDTTVVLSTFYNNHLGSPDKSISLSNEDKETIKPQWEKMKKFFESIKDKYGLIPDLVGRDNIVIVRQNGRPQIKILDFGFISKRFPDRAFLLQAKLKAALFTKRMNSNYT